MLVNVQLRACAGIRYILLDFLVRKLRFLSFLTKCWRNPLRNCLYFCNLPQQKDSLSKIINKLYAWFQAVSSNFDMHQRSNSVPLMRKSQIFI